MLRYGATADGIAKLRRRRGLSLTTQDDIELYLGPGRRHRHLFEAMLDASSPLIGLSFPFFEVESGSSDGAMLAVQLYHAAVIAHRPLQPPVRPTRRSHQHPEYQQGDHQAYQEFSHSQSSSVPPVERRPLQAGDTIVLEALSSFAETHATMMTTGNNTRQGGGGGGFGGDFGIVRKLGEDGTAPRFRSASDRAR